jgi:hypothetical protein
MLEPAYDYANRTIWRMNESHGRHRHLAAAE